MVDYSDGTERFVETPGIVDICVISDDPDFFAEPEDLFDRQGQGLPERWDFGILQNELRLSPYFYSATSPVQAWGEEQDDQGAGFLQMQHLRMWTQ